VFSTLSKGYTPLFSTKKLETSYAIICNGLERVSFIPPKNNQFSIICIRYEEDKIAELESAGLCQWSALAGIVETRSAIQPVILFLMPYSIVLSHNAQGTCKGLSQHRPNLIGAVA
jgi:hypothetical protein